MTSSRWKLPATLAAAGLVAALAATPAVAQDATAAPAPHGPIVHILKCLKIVDLTDAQKADIKALIEKAKPNLEAIRTQTKTDVDALKALLAASTVDPCAVGNAWLKVRADRKAFWDEVKAIKEGVDALLTPAQVAKLNGCLQAPKDAPTTAAEDPGDGGPIE